MEDVLKRYHYRESQEAMEAFESTFSSQKYSNNYYEGFLPQWRHFIECVQKKEKPRYSLAESLESLKLVYAALISATRDEEVILDALGAEDYAEISISNETKGG